MKEEIENKAFLNTLLRFWGTNRAAEPRPHQTSRGVCIFTTNLSPIRVMSIEFLFFYVSLSPLSPLSPSFFSPPPSHFFFVPRVLGKIRLQAKVTVFGKRRDAQNIQKKNKTHSPRKNDDVSFFGGVSSPKSFVFVLINCWSSVVASGCVATVCAISTFIFTPRLLHTPSLPLIVKVINHSKNGQAMRDPRISSYIFS